MLLRVHAASAHIGDWHVMTGLPYLIRLVVPTLGLRAPKTRVRGMDVAGTVEAVGKDVTRFRPGDEVFGICNGSFAEYATARADKLAPKPANLTFEQAAAVPISGCTALQALRDKAQVQPGQKVLIIGASGGVGRSRCRSPRRSAPMSPACAARRRSTWSARSAPTRSSTTRARTSRRAASATTLILDMGGNRSVSQLRRALTPKGTLVIVGGEGGGRWFGGFGRNLRALMLSPFVSQRLRLFASTEKGEDLVVLKELIEAGKVTPVIDRTYPLERGPEAIRHLEAGHARGKIVITI